MAAKKTSAKPNTLDNATYASAKVACVRAVRKQYPNVADAEDIAAGALEETASVWDPDRGPFVALALTIAKRRAIDAARTDTRRAQAQPKTRPDTTIAQGERSELGPILARFLESAANEIEPIMFHPDAVVLLRSEIDYLRQDLKRGGPHARRLAGLLVFPDDFDAHMEERRTAIVRLGSTGWTESEDTLDESPRLRGRRRPSDGTMGSPPTVFRKKRDDVARALVREGLAACGLPGSKFNALTSRVRVEKDRAEARERREILARYERLRRGG